MTLHKVKDFLQNHVQDLDRLADILVIVSLIYSLTGWLDIGPLQAIVDVLIRIAWGVLTLAFIWIRKFGMAAFYLALLVIPVILTCFL